MIQLADLLDKYSGKENHMEAELRSAHGTATKMALHFFAYNEDRCIEKRPDSPEEWKEYIKSPQMLWINIDGIRHNEILERIGKDFSLHPLVLEDIAGKRQRPKIEDYGEYLFLILKMISYDEHKKKIVIEQTSFIIGEQYVISFGERDGDVFEPVRERLRNRIGRLRKLGADYLAYCLVDAIVDNYFIVLEKLGDEIEAVENELLRKPHSAILNKIHILKRELLLIHKAVWPLREVTGTLTRNESSLVSEETGIYLRDVYDNVIQIMDTTEVYRDMLSGMLDIYLSSTSNRMNEIMKVLTIISTIFMPLTFIAGIYGMNFHYMPELEWRWGYPVSLLLMALAVAAMLLYFKKKKWL